MAGLRHTWDFYLWFPYKMAGDGQFVLDTQYRSKDDNKEQIFFNGSFWARGQPNGVQNTCLDCNEEGGQFLKTMLKGQFHEMVVEMRLWSSRLGLN
jgi:hypothetical protein